MLCDHFGWRAAFGLQLPFIFALFIVALLATPIDLGPRLGKAENKTLWQTIKDFDIKGSVLLLFSVTTLILGLNLGGNVLDWTHPVVVVSLVLFAVSSLCLIKVEGRAARPVLPMTFLSKAPKANLIFSNFLGIVITQTILFNVPLFFQTVKLESPTASGLKLMPPGICMTVSGVIIGFYITWSRRLKSSLLLGAGFILLGSITTSLLSRHTPTWLTLIMISPASVGNGMLFPVATVAILAISDKEDNAVVTTTIGLWRSIGSVMGVSISSWILQNTLKVFLEKFVTGDPKEKHDIVQTVRRSVKAIRDLDPLHQEQGTEH